MTPRDGKDDDFKRASEGSIPMNPVEQALKSMVNIVWHDYDTDKSGSLEKDEAFKFIQDIQKKAS